MTCDEARPITRAKYNGTLRLIVTVIAMAVAGPLGLGAAVYLSEYAPNRVRKLLKPVLEILQPKDDLSSSIGDLCPELAKLQKDL